MHKQTAFKLMLFTSLVCYLFLPFLIKPAQASDIIYIRTSGVIEPVSAPISRSGSTYTLTSDITTDSTNGIVIELGGIILDGAGFTLEGEGSAAVNGIRLEANNIIVRNISITGFDYGIRSIGRSYNYITETSIFNNHIHGIYLSSSQYYVINCNAITTNAQAGLYLSIGQHNTISKNTIQDQDGTTGQFGGIRLDSAYHNAIFDNNIISNYYGMYIRNSGLNRIFHNNFTANFCQAYDFSDLSTPPSDNEWNSSYPTGGNYWSNYAGTDTHYGPNHEYPGKDGIGDTPKAITPRGIDYYPLMHPWTPTETTYGTYPITLSSNTTITSFTANLYALDFNIEGSSPGGGYILAIIPKDANATEITVLIDGNPPPNPYPIITANSTHYFVYFEFTLSNHDVLVFLAIPEYLLGTILALGALFAAFGVSRRLTSKT